MIENLPNYFYVVYKATVGPTRFCEKEYEEIFRGPVMVDAKFKETLTIYKCEVETTQKVLRKIKSNSNQVIKSDIVYNIENSHTLKNINESIININYSLKHIYNQMP